MTWLLRRNTSICIVIGDVRSTQSMPDSKAFPISAYGESEFVYNSTIGSVLRNKRTFQMEIYSHRVYLRIIEHLRQVRRLSKFSSFSEYIPRVGYHGLVLKEPGESKEATVVHRDNRPCIEWATKYKKSKNHVEVRNHICLGAAKNKEFS